MTVEVLAPDPGPLDQEGLERALERLAKERTLEVASAKAVAFLDDLSRAIFAEPAAKGHVELQALAFWLRRANVERMVAGLLQPRPYFFRVPRGLVFHVAPSNVDTMFVYSWALALLAGNPNVIRLSQRSSDQVRLLSVLARKVMETPEHEPIRRSTLLLTYGHDEVLTRCISRHSDVRMIWGGNLAVAAIRQVPAKPGTKDIPFRDRYSMATLAAKPFLGLGDVQADRLAQDFFNDCFSFNQMACSSPRFLAWIGPQPDCTAAARRFAACLQAAVECRGYEVPASVAIQKLSVAADLAADGTVVGFQRPSNELMISTLGQVEALPRPGQGGGFLLEAFLPSLESLTGLLQPDDQTLVHWGFPQEDLERLAKAANGRGLDRLVPVGRGLEFSPFWEGEDLLQELTRLVHLLPGNRAGPSDPAGPKEAKA